ncbi:MAG: hypothetical protein WCL44_04235 [bacterium]
MDRAVNVRTPGHHVYKDISPADNRPALWFAIAALVTLTLAGCMSVGGKTVAEARRGGPPDTAAVASARRSLASMYPGTACMTHRAVLTVHGRQFAFDGYVVKSNDYLRLVARGTVGLVAEVEWTARAGAKVLRTGRFFKQRWSEAYMARDLVLLCAPPQQLPIVESTAGGCIVLGQDNIRDNTMLRYVFSPDGMILQEIQAGRPGRPNYTARIAGYRQFEGYSQPVPAEIAVDGEGYSLHLFLVNLTQGRQTGDINPSESRL